MSATAAAAKGAVDQSEVAKETRALSLVPLTTLMIDADIVARFKATGAGWEERMAEVLRKAQV